MKKRAELEKFSNKDCLRLPGGGRKPQTLEYENELLISIKHLRSLNIPITSTIIIIEAIKIIPAFKNKSYNALHCWFFDFIKRIGYSCKNIEFNSNNLIYIWSDLIR